MNTEQTEIKSISIAKYASEVAKTRTRVLPGAPGTFWAGYEAGTLLRVPSFHLVPPTQREVEQAQRSGRAVVISYLREPDDRHLANAWLYVYRGPYYGLDILSKAARRDAHRAQRSLKFAFLDWTNLFQHGFPAFTQTRSRIGLSDGTLDQFRKHFELFSRNCAHYAVGAWSKEQLVAFMILIAVEDWVDIVGVFSTNSHLSLCPNNGLAHYVLDFFITQRGFRAVGYGVSSVQQSAETIGLHAYKKKVGFEAQPVHRVFVLHPLIRPFAKRLTVKAVQTLLRFRPGDRRLRKASGILNLVLGNVPPLVLEKTGNASS